MLQLFSLDQMRPRSRKLAFPNILEGVTGVTGVTANFTQLHRRGSLPRNHTVHQHNMNLLECGTTGVTANFIQTNVEQTSFSRIIMNVLRYRCYRLYIYFHLTKLCLNIHEKGVTGVTGWGFLAVTLFMHLQWFQRLQWDILGVLRLLSSRFKVVLQVLQMLQVLQVFYTEKKKHRKKACEFQGANPMDFG